VARVRWTLQALDDVDAVCDYIARDAPRTAKRFGRRFFEAVEPLERHPHSGQIVPELRRDDIREVRLRRYRIIYRVRSEDLLEILTVWHGSRLLDIDAFGLE
jgi:addiction module RelE/StbE family toxin